MNKLDESEEEILDDQNEDGSDTEGISERRDTLMKKPTYQDLSTQDLTEETAYLHF